MQREEELKQPVTSLDDKRILQIGQKPHSDCHHKLRENASCVQRYRLYPAGGTKPVRDLLKSVFIGMFDFTLKTSLSAEGNDGVIHAILMVHRFLTLKYIHY